MRYCILILLFFIVTPVFAQNTSVPVVVDQDKGILIRSITIEGFVLGDKDRFNKLFKPYRNKYLNVYDMDKMLQEIQVIYEGEGYQQLVTVSFKVIKHHLVYTALMTS